MTAISRRTLLFVFLTCCFAMQVVIMRRTDAFPDIVLLVVVFSGIFLGGAEAVIVGLIAGFFRGCFSVGTMGLDIFLFPLLGAFSSALGRRVYRQDPVAQVLTVISALVILVVSHTAYLNILSGNSISVWSMFLRSWKALAATVIISPLFFAFSKRLLKIP